MQTTKLRHPRYTRRLSLSDRPSNTHMHCRATRRPRKIPPTVAWLLSRYAGQCAHKGGHAVLCCDIFVICFFVYHCYYRGVDQVRTKQLERALCFMHSRLGRVYSAR